jgi:hypothetical protein
LISSSSRALCLFSGLYLPNFSCITSEVFEVLITKDIDPFEGILYLLWESNKGMVAEQNNFLNDLLLHIKNSGFNYLDFLNKTHEPDEELKRELRNAVYALVGEGYFRLEPNKGVITLRFLSKKSTVMEKIL